MTGLHSSPDPAIRFIISVPDWRPEEATPFQGFAVSLCRNSGLLRFIQQMPTTIFELTPEVLPYRLAQRIAGQAPVNWYGQSPRALKSHPVPLEIPFTIIFLNERESVSDYDEWLGTCPGPVTLVAKEGGHIPLLDLSLEAIQTRFLAVCETLRSLGNVDHIDEAVDAISSWKQPDMRQFPHKIGGHGTIFPNASVLRLCGFDGIAEEPFSRHQEGEKAHIEQIVSTTNAVFDERESSPPSLANQIYPRTPDLNFYCPATYDFRSAFHFRNDIDRDTRRELDVALRLLDRQSSYGFEIKSETQQKVALGITPEGLMQGETPIGNPIMTMRQQELWLGTEAVGCLAVSEIGAVVRLPNRLNLARGAVRQFAQHYRADRPQMLKRREMFRKAQRAIAKGFPDQFRNLLDRSRDGIRVIADAHLEWLDVRGIPLGLRYNVSRIPVTPGNSFIEQLATPPAIYTSPDAFRDILVVSGLEEGDIIAKQFEIAFAGFGEHWREKLNVKFVRVKSRQELIDAINAFEGTMMVFDGHGSHKPDRPGMLWLGEEGVDIWALRGEISRPPPVVILSACDTHAADRNHATVANGFLALGSRSVLGSVFPLHASHAAIFTARLLYRVSDYLPAAIGIHQRSLTWLEVVSGMLRRQLTTDILRYLKQLKLIPESEEEFLDLSFQIHMIADMAPDDPMTHVRQELLNYGIPEARLDRAIESAVAGSSTISYVHLGRPETILINTSDNIEAVLKTEEGQLT